MDFLFFFCYIILNMQFLKLFIFIDYISMFVVKNKVQFSNDSIIKVSIMVSV